MLSFRVFIEIVLVKYFRVNYCNTCCRTVWAILDAVVGMAQPRDGLAAFKGDWTRQVEKAYIRYSLYMLPAYIR